MIHEAFPPAAALLIVFTAAELVEPGVASGSQNLPVLTVGVLILGVLRVALDLKQRTA